MIGLASAGGDTVNAIKQAAEFGIVKGGQGLAGLLFVAPLVSAIGQTFGARPHIHGDLVLGHERGQSRVDAAMAGRAAR